MPTVILTEEEANTVLSAIQYAREAIEVEYEDIPAPPRFATARQMLVEAAVIILNH